jgi:arylsulfatase A-like enzyme
MDFGAYGSDTATPNIDRLGQSGVMFARHYTLPLCGPSRASLMTGQDNHVVGAGTLAEALTDEMRELPAYSMVWEDNQETVASRLQASGYQTFVTGKWGIGHAGDNLPHRFGFDRSFVLDATGASNYRPVPYVPLYTEVSWFEDGERVYIPDDFYSSREYVDRMIAYIDEADPDRPFFGYLSFQAVHLPVQAPREFIDHYDGVFDRGWDVMREERLQRAIELGLVPEGSRLAPAPESNRRWDDLTDDEKAYWARAMQVNAGMMEAADFHLGRLLDHLESSGRLDNTIVIVTSDNGPEYNTMGLLSQGRNFAVERSWMAMVGWDVTLENLGQPGSLASIGPEWATVSAAPLHLFKFSAAEGGVRVPLVVAGPGIASRGFVQARSQISDLTPTLLDAAGVDYDPEAFDGRSLLPVLTGEAEQAYGERDPIAIEVSGTVALYRGHMKLTRTPPPYGDGEWHLYDMSVDPGETVDVAAEHEELFQEMQSEYASYAEEVGVFELPAGATARDAITDNAHTKLWHNYWHLVVGLVLALIALVVGASFGARQLWRRLRPRGPAPAES